KISMKKFLCFAAPMIVPFIVFGSSAFAQPAGDGASASRNAASAYCWKDKLQVTGTALVCNWADSAEEACKGNPTSDISKDSVSGEPSDARRCNNGKWLVQVTKK
ncbi:MAG: hypothetical protein ABI905_18400, partial [Betaproteobacteria bacterium]